MDLIHHSKRRFLCPPTALCRFLPRSQKLVPHPWRIGDHTIDPRIRHWNNKEGLLLGCNHAGAQLDLSLLQCPSTLNRLTTASYRDFVRPLFILQVDTYAMIINSSTLHQLLSPTTDLSNLPAWKQLINYTIATRDRIPLITTIFSDRGEAEKVRRLSGDDAQTFIDMVDEASPQNGWVDSRSHFYTLSARCWIVSHPRYARGVHMLFTEFVAAKPWFHGHWKFHFVTTQRRIHCAMVDSQMCGRGGIKVRKLQPRS